MKNDLEQLRLIKEEGQTDDDRCDGFIEYA